MCPVLASAGKARVRIPWCCWGLADVRGGEEGLCRTLVVVLTHRHCRLFHVSPGEQLPLAAEHLQSKTERSRQMYVWAFQLVTCSFPCARPVLSQLAHVSHLRLLLPSARLLLLNVCPLCLVLKRSPRLPLFFEKATLFINYTYFYAGSLTPTSGRSTFTCFDPHFLIGRHCLFGFHWPELLLGIKKKKKNYTKGWLVSSFWGSGLWLRWTWACLERQMLSSWNRVQTLHVNSTVWASSFNKLETVTVVLHPLRVCVCVPLLTVEGLSWWCCELVCRSPAWKDSCTGCGWPRWWLPAWCLV